MERCFAGIVRLAILPLVVTVACPWILLPQDVHAGDRDVIFEDDFDDREKIGDGYYIGQGTEEAWQIKDGVLSGKQTKADHGATIRKEIDFDDFDVEFDFRFNGGSRFNLVIDDKREKSVHAGHICRVSISPNKLTIGDDKTGVMNQKIRDQRKDKNLSAEKKAKLEELLATKQSSAKVKLKKGKWYTLRVRIEDDLMEAYIDGEKVTSLESEGIDHPTKTKFGMTVNGESFEFDNLKVYETSTTK